MNYCPNCDCSRCYTKKQKKFSFNKVFTGYATTTKPGANPGEVIACTTLFINGKEIPKEDYEKLGVTTDKDGNPTGMSWRDK